MASCRMLRSSRGARPLVPPPSMLRMRMVAVAGLTRMQVPAVAPHSRHSSVWIRIGCIGAVKGTDACLAYPVLTGQAILGSTSDTNEAGAFRGQELPVLLHYMRLRISGGLLQGILSLEADTTFGLKGQRWILCVTGLGRDAAHSWTPPNEAERFARAGTSSLPILSVCLTASGGHYGWQAWATLTSWRQMVETGLQGRQTARTWGFLKSGSY
jgi:hypothetical protein